MSWEAVTAAGTIFTGVVILGTALIGFDQLRQARTQRRDAAAVELVRSLQDDAFLEAYRVIFGAEEEARLSGPDQTTANYNKAAIVLGFRFEMLGVLVFRGTIPFDIAEDLVGGFVLLAWRRLKTTTLGTRTALGWPMFLEWFQWLAEQLEKRQRLEQTPAHLRAADWRPYRDS
jgi:hypothetical protein